MAGIDNLSDLEKLTKLTYGAVAGQVARDNPKLAHKAIDDLIPDLDLDEATIATLQSFMSTDKGAQTAAANYAGAYEKVRQGTDVATLVQNYESHGILQRAGDHAERIKRDLLKFGNMNYGEILKEIDAANTKIKGKDNEKNGYTEEQVKAAEATIRKYERVTKTIDLLENAYLSPTLRKVSDEYLNGGIKAIGEEIEAEEQQAA